MGKKSINKNIDYKQLIPEYSDDEIISILQKRKHYQPEAAELAIKEAIKRGLINSEQDLFDAKFEHQQLKRNVFPTIENEKAKKKTIKSIARGLLVTGIIPVVWGFLRINEAYTFEGGLILFIGVLWMFFSAYQMRKVNPKLIFLQILLLHVCIAYVVKNLIDLKITAVMDFAIVGVLYVLIMYGLIFIGRLNKQK